MTRTKYRRVMAAAAVALTGAACGGASDINPAAGGEGTSGSVVVSGSSTVEPISALNAEKFSGANPAVEISVDGPGTGDGFELFCNGETDISDASRPIQEEEVAACEDQGIEFIELKVAIDGLSVVTSPANGEVDCLGFEDLYALLGPESKGFERWSDANALGEELDASHVPYPDAPLVVTAPGEESGTYDSFTEIVLEGIAEQRGLPEEKWAPRPDYQSSPNDNVIIEGISGSDTSLGWVGYAFFTQNEEGVKALEIEDEDGSCVAPTPETISAGDYPIARDLYIYVNAAKAEDGSALEQYVDFYLSDDGLSSVSEVGYVDLAPEDVEETREVWEARETGSRDGG